jgi:cytochrome c-type biogenesis protein CcmF
MVDKKGNVRTEVFQLPPLGMQFGFIGIEPKAGKIHIRVIEQLPPDDRITIKAIAKPFINLLWLGTFILAVGFFLAFLRRLRN